MSEYKGINKPRKSLAVIKEKDGIRGLVPSAKYGLYDRVYCSYLDTLNPRDNEEVQLALACATDGRFQEFLNRIREKKYARVSVATIAKACGIDLKEFQDWWNKASSQRAIALAQMGSVNMTRDMIKDAASIDGDCDRCEGLGWISAPDWLPEDTPGYRCLDPDPDDPKWIRTCPKCGGKATIRRPGDSHARDKILEMSGLVQKGKPVLSLTQNFGGASHASAVSDLNDAMTFDVKLED